MREKGGQATLPARRLPMPLAFFRCGLLALLVRRMRAARRLPMPLAFFRCVLGHRRVAALPASASCVRKAVFRQNVACPRPPDATRHTHSSDACLGTDVLHMSLKRLVYDALSY